jgi:hypothetical protein
MPTSVNHFCPSLLTFSIVVLYTHADADVHTHTHIHIYVYELLQKYWIGGS